MAKIYCLNGNIKLFEHVCNIYYHIPIAWNFNIYSMGPILAPKQGYFFVYIPLHPPFP